MIRLVASLFLSACLAGVAWADDSGLRKLDRPDEAQVWSAVGRINIGDQGFCTGTLIEPQLVLTAAHCFFDRDTGAPVDPSIVRFVAGWNDGTAQAVRSVRRLLVDPEYQFNSPDNADRVSHDLALIELDQPMTSAIHPFARYYSPQYGDTVSVVSYAQDRSEVPSIEEACQILDKESDVLVLSCSVNFGASGSPIFFTDRAGPRIASVVSAMADMNGQRVSLGVALDDNLDKLIRALEKTDPIFLSRKPGTSLAEQLGRPPNGTSGFIRVP